MSEDNKTQLWKYLYTTRTHVRKLVEFTCTDVAVTSLLSEFKVAILVVELILLSISNVKIENVANKRPRFCAKTPNVAKWHLLQWIWVRPAWTCVCGCITFRVQCLTNGNFSGVQAYLILISFWPCHFYGHTNINKSNQRNEKKGKMWNKRSWKSVWAL